MDSLTNVIIALGGWAIITIAVATWIGRRIAERLNIKWKMDQEKELEQLRANITRDHNMLNAAINSFSAGHHASDERRFCAIETMWKSMLELRSLFGSVIFFYDILLPTEYNDPRTNKMVSDVINSKDKISNNYHSLRNDVVSYRPFLGEYLWILFSIYFIFISRTYHLFAKGVENKKIESWRNDKAIIRLLGTVLTEEDLSRNRLDSIDEFRLPDSASWILDLMELKILLETSRLISGEAVADISLNQMKRYYEAIQDANLDKKS
jgi:hypothetical protein